jgi:cytochrome P450
MEAKGGPADLVVDYALALPIEMLSSLLGVPSADRARFEGWAASLLSTTERSPERIQADVEELHGYMAGLIAERRAEPRDDLLSALAHARDKDETLTDAEILPIAFILILGGFDNTANAIAGGVLALLRDDEQRARFLADIDGLAPTMAEEVLRHGRFATGEDVVTRNHVPFVATEDLVIDGQPIAAGEAVAVDTYSTGHDPAAFDRPERFDIGRTENPHLNLSYGAHHCLGAPLARMEVQVGVSEVFRRLPTLRPAGPATFDTHNISQPMSSLPVAW